MSNITLFAQIINNVNRPKFKAIVSKYETDKHSKGINSWTHLVSMLFCHFAKANSLREISNGLCSVAGNLNHLGITKKFPRKSSLSYINQHRNWMLFKDFYMILLRDFQARTKFKQVKFRIRKKIFLLDATTVSLCLSMFDWARYRQTKGAVKLHTLLDYDGCLPEYVDVTDGKKHDVTIAKKMQIPSNSVVVADRAYLDFALLNKWNKQKINFVVRCKEIVKFIEHKEYQLPEDKHEHILKDREVILSASKTRNAYSGKLRMVSCYDENRNQVVYLLTNNLTWTANTISELYKQRWQIEIFFKELKQHLKIKSFVGTSSNAVMIQIWTALITILILKYLKQIAKYNWSLSNMIAFMRMNLFVKIELQNWLDNPFKPPEEVIDVMQLYLYDTSNLNDRDKNENIK